MANPLRISFLFCLLYCVSALPSSALLQRAQESTAPLEAYAKWRATLGDQSSVVPHYSLAARTERQKGSVRIDFAAVGQMAGGYALEIRPVRERKSATGGSDREVAGEASNVRQEMPREFSVPNPVSESRVIIPADDAANALEVVWTFNGRGQDYSYTVILPLENAPSTNVVGIVPPSKVRPLSDGCSGTCVWVQGNNGRCGTFSKCCRDYIGNQVDLVNCTITSGSECIS